MGKRREKGRLPKWRTSRERQGCVPRTHKRKGWVQSGTLDNWIKTIKGTYTGDTEEDKKKIEHFRGGDSLRRKNGGFGRSSRRPSGKNSGGGKGCTLEHGKGAVERIKRTYIGRGKLHVGTLARV